MPFEDDTGRLRRFAGGVADVEAFDSEGVDILDREVQRIDQRPGARVLRALFSEQLRQLEFRARDAHVQPGTARLAGLVLGSDLHTALHRQRFDQVNPPDEDQEHLGLRHHSETRDGATEGHRAGVAHEHLGRERVEPEEPDHSTDQRGGEDCHVEVVATALSDRPRADPGDCGDGEEGEDRDCARARCEAVEAIGQVDAVRSARNHEEEEREVEPVQVDVDVDHREVDLGVEIPDLRHDPADSDRDQHQPEHLPTA